MSILSWAGKGPVCTFLEVSTWGPLPRPHTLSSGQGSDPPVPLVAPSQVLWQEVTLSSCCSLPSLGALPTFPFDPLPVFFILLLILWPPLEDHP